MRFSEPFGLNRVDPCALRTGIPTYLLYTYTDYGLVLPLPLCSLLVTEEGMSRKAFGK